jgi:malonyl-CoA O-methyltransferase
LTETNTPPTLDTAAARRWLRLSQAAPSAWLHEEVARRMAERLDWIKLQPQAWLHWEPMAGGAAADTQLRQRYPRAECFWALAGENTAQSAINLIAKPWWNPARWRQNLPQPALPPGKQVQMLWANMALHFEPAPQNLIARWYSALATDGFLMFSCLGPDTCVELHHLYAELGWGPAGHAFTDMHDWGDMLVQNGFAEPVMDMERISLTFETPERALQELRELGRNLHPQRFAALRGRAWHRHLLDSLLRLRNAEGQIVLTFEVIYGHALKPAPRVKMSESSAVSLQDMRAMLQQKKSG